MRTQCDNALREGEFDTLDSLATVFLTIARKGGNREEEGWAHYFLGTYRSTVDPMPPEQISHLDSAESLVSQNDRALQLRLNNTRGLWTLRNLNFPVALIYFERALELAKEENDDRMVLGVESNLTEVYRLMNDTLGFRHSKEIYDRSCREGYDDLKVASAFSCASYLAAHSADSIQLHPYLEVISKSRMLKGWDRILRAAFLERKGEYEKADTIMTRLDSVKWQTTYPIVLMAGIKSALGEYDSSDSLIQRANELYSVIHQDNGWADLVRLEAVNNAGKGNYGEAFRKMERFSTLQDSLNRSADINAAHAWRMRFQVKEKEEKLRDAEKETERLGFIVKTVVGVAVMIVAGFAVFYRYRRKHYLRIISQTRESLLLEDELKRQQEELKRELSLLRQNAVTSTEEDSKNIPPEAGKTAGGISEERIDEIFGLITRQMEENRIWADLNVTRESFAELVGVNRTYFSQVIKSKTGQTYTQFMNARRIREAVRMISASEDIRLSEVARKAGFVSESNFYATFRKTMGMKPSEFIRLSKEEKQI